MGNHIGQQLGNYRLLQLLGRGGFADVYLGEHIYMHSQAAIKVLHTRLTSEDMEDFRLEARTVAHLDHPHIVHVLEFGITEATPFLAMSYAPNGTLRQRHPRGTQLPLSIIVEYVKQIADALQYAHEQKLIHRDVKPENMLLGRRNEVLLSDFGIALIAQNSRSQRTQEAIGTAAYMAPEQIRGKPRPASDQYSLGIVVYEWLSGSLPFSGQGMAMFVQHLQTQPMPLREKIAGIPPDVEQVVMRAIAKDPKGRFASIEAFAAALEQASRPSTETTRVKSCSQELLNLMPPSSKVSPPTEKASTPTTLTNTAIASSQLQQFSSPTSSETPERSLGPDTGQHQSSVTDRSINKLKPKRQQSLSRRTALLGLAGVVALGAGGGGLAWWALTPHPLYTYRGHTDGVIGVRWSPDGTRIASASSYKDKTIQIWDAIDGGHVFTYRGHVSGEYATLTNIAWSPNGKRIASSGFEEVQVWDATDGDNLYIYRGQSDTVFASSWSPDSKRIASASKDETVQVWDEANGGNVFTYTDGGYAPYGIADVAWSPDGRHIACTDTAGVRVWDVSTGQNTYTYSSGGYPLAWSPDSKRIASGGASSTIHVWDVADGGHFYVYRGHTNSDTVSHPTLYAVAWSPDGKRIASGSEDKTVQVWDAVDGSHVSTYRGHSSAVYTIAWSPDGKRIASGSADKTVQVWKID
jgi:serine/threonine protein kinase/Tol biopolymer transport system component